MLDLEALALDLRWFMLDSVTFMLDLDAFTLDSVTFVLDSARVMRDLDKNKLPPYQVGEFLAIPALQS